MHKKYLSLPVAQLDRAADYEYAGCACSTPAGEIYI